MRRRIRRSGSEVVISYSVEVDVEVTCHVTPGEAPAGPTYDCAGTPGCGPEVEILVMRSEAGANLDSLIDELSKADLLAIEELAIEAAGDAEEAAEEAAAEARADAQRERALFGED